MGYAIALGAAMGVLWFAIYVAIAAAFNTLPHREVLALWLPVFVVWNAFCGWLGWYTA